MEGSDARNPLNRFQKLAPGAKVAKDVASKVAEHEKVQQSVEDLVEVLVERQFAKGQAMRFAEQTGTLAADIQFLDGSRRWVIFDEKEPIAAFPPYSDDLADALRFHKFDLLVRKGPDQLKEEIEADRERRKRWWKVWEAGKDADTEVFVERLLLEAGED